YVTPDTIQWGAQGNWLAFLTIDPDGKGSIGLFSPGKNQKLSFDIASTFYSSSDTQLLWSPDGLHVAVVISSYPEKDGWIWWMDVFGVDGTVFQKVTTMARDQYIIAGAGVDLPMVRWAADGKSLLFPQERLDLPDDQADLVAFQLDKGRKVI